MSSLVTVSFHGDELQAEEWRPVVNCPRYEVSSLGRVRSSVRSKREPLVLSPMYVRGYQRVSIFTDGKPKWRPVHHLVLEAFKGPRPDGAMGRHVVDHCRSDNRPENLEWGTNQQNVDDRGRHGRTARGERVSTAKLTPEDVVAIRAHRGFLTQAHLAELFGVCQRQIRMVQLGRHWTCIPMEQGVIQTSELAKQVAHVLGDKATVIVCRHATRSQGWYAEARSPLIDIRVHNRKTRRGAVAGLIALLHTLSKVDLAREHGVVFQ
jgi:hypothetical protein